MSELVSIEADRIALRIVSGINDAVTDADDRGDQFAALITDVFGPGAPPPGEIMLALGRRLLVHYRELYGPEAVGSLLAYELARLAAVESAEDDDDE